MSPTGVSPALRSIVGLGLTEGVAGLLARRFTLYQPPGDFNREAPVIVVQNARVDESEMARQPGLKLIAVFGAGYDRVDVAAAQARGLVLANTPGVTNTCVADMAMALLLAVSRQVCVGDRHVRGGLWPHGRLPLASRFSGRRLGIFGLGGIGAAIARRAAGFDLEIAYHNRHRREDLPYKYFDDLAALATWADYLVVACPASPETYRRVDAKVLAALGPAGIVVNIARGSIIDEEALIEALERRTIAGAGLDVFAQEPQVPPRLFALDNVVLAPHVAGSTHETWNEATALLLENLDHYFATGRPLTPVAL
jgi:hydroxypyruvate reductase